MANQYAPLIAAWNAKGALPGGVVGVALTSGMPTATALANLNAWTITGTIPTTFFVTGDQLLNALNFAEFNTLSAPHQTQMLQICATPGQIMGGASSFVGGVVVNYYSNVLAGPTIANFTALAKAVVTPWWQIQPSQGGLGFGQPVSLADLAVNGLS